MNNYISNLLFCEGHKASAKKKLPRYQHHEVVYSTKQQLASKKDTSPHIDEAGIKRVQRIVGSILYYARAVNNKLLVALSTIRYQQAEATANTATAVHQLLNYVATYPTDSIVFCASAMALVVHADAGFNNDSRSFSRAGANI